MTAKINKVYIDKEYKDLITVQIPRMKSAYDKMVATFKLFFNFIQKLFFKICL